MLRSATIFLVIVLSLFFLLRRKAVDEPVRQGKTYLETAVGQDFVGLSIRRRGPDVPAKLGISALVVGVADMVHVHEERLVPELALEERVVNEHHIPAGRLDLLHIGGEPR